ncbi:MAG: stage IV sporulation protein FB [Psychromonas sp.]|jgi:stage IV sporulation protein FB
MEEYRVYPEKPEIKVKEKKSDIGQTIFTMVLFVMAFLFLFSDSIELILLLLLVLLIHELGHFAFMKVFKYRNVRMFFVPLMGAFVQGVKDKYSQWQSFIVVLAGPLPGIILGIGLFVLGQEFKNDWMITLSLMFMFLNVVNLLPLDPLDGGQLLKLLFRKNVELFQLILSLVSSLIMIMIGIYMYEYILIGFGFLMGLRVRSIQKRFSIHKELNEEKIEYTIAYKDLSDENYAKIKQVVLNNTPALVKYAKLNGDGEDIEPVIAVQVQGVLTSPIDFDTHLWHRMLIVLIWVATFAIPVLLLKIYSLGWYLDGF